MLVLLNQPWEVRGRDDDLVPSYAASLLRIHSGNVSHFHCIDSVGTPLMSEKNRWTSVILSILTAYPHGAVRGLASPRNLI